MIASADGCKRGWILARCKGWPPTETPALEIHPDFGAVIGATATCEIVVVDMPIGLPEAGCRACDEEAKKYLGGQAHSRVFYAPPRATLDVTDWKEFVTIHRGANGRGLSKQAFGLLAKLRDVDAAMTPALQERVREFHPELAWRHLAGHLLSSKHTAAGSLERLRLLRYLVPALDDLDKDYPGAAAKAALDDVLDALVGLWVAARIAAGGRNAQRLPANDPPKDTRVLRMEIWY